MLLAVLRSRWFSLLRIILPRLVRDEEVSCLQTRENRRWASKAITRRSLSSHWRSWQPSGLRQQYLLRTPSERRTIHLSLPSRLLQSYLNRARIMGASSPVLRAASCCRHHALICRCPCSVLYLLCNVSALRCPCLGAALSFSAMSLRYVTGSRAIRTLLLTVDQVSSVE